MPLIQVVVEDPIRRVADAPKVGTYSNCLSSVSFLYFLTFILITFTFFRTSQHNEDASRSSVNASHREIDARKIVSALTAETELSRKQVNLEAKVLP